jgi:hypothetical protein
MLHAPLTSRSIRVCIREPPGGPDVRNAEPTEAARLRGERLAGLAHNAQQFI